LRITPQVIRPRSKIHGSASCTSTSKRSSKVRRAGPNQLWNDDLMSVH
jgi:hypothetical protein